MEHNRNCARNTRHRLGSLSVQERKMTLPWPGSKTPGNDGRIQLVDGQLEADGSPVAHLQRFTPLVDEGDGGVFPRGGDFGVGAADVVNPIQDKTFRVYLSLSGICIHAQSSVLHVPELLYNLIRGKRIAQYVTSISTLKVSREEQPLRSGTQWRRLCVCAREMSHNLPLQPLDADGE